MLFHSYEFIFVFLPITFLIYFFLNQNKLTSLSKAWIVFSSMVFYSWWNIVYLPLLLASILFNFILTNKMIEHESSRNKYLSKRSLLLIGLVFNVGLLIYFKYMDFFILNTNLLFNSGFELLHLALPLAISFFTLQQIAFLIDCYEGLVEEKKFLEYATFVAFFPQLIAGPIVHHKQMMPQFSNLKNKIKNYRNISLGLFIFSIGLFKKIVIADSFAVWSTAGFDTSATLNLFEAWATSLSFTFQVYFDFSGYSDMAIGAALLFNIKLPQNFNSPYKAKGIIEFWQRWHMTLTNFINTYVYTSMLRSFRNVTFVKTMFVTFITFIIVGLWHGASWMFILFGALHGLAMIINHLWRKTKIKLHFVLSWFLTFNFVNMSLVIFRAKDWDDAFKVLSSMLSLDNIVLPSFLATTFPYLRDYGIEFGGFVDNIQADKFIIVWLFLGFSLVLLFKNSVEKLQTFQLNKKTVLFTTSCFVISILSLNKVSEFLYFNF